MTFLICSNMYHQNDQCLRGKFAVIIKEPFSHLQRQQQAKGRLLLASVVDKFLQVLPGGAEPVMTKVRQYTLRSCTFFASSLFKNNPARGDFNADRAVGDR